MLPTFVLNDRGSPPDGWICCNNRTKDLMARSSNAEEEEEEEEEEKKHKNKNKKNKNKNKNK